MNQLKGFPPKIQIANNQIMHIFGEDLYLYDRSQRNGYIQLNPIEKSIVQAINEYHDIDSIWKTVCTEYHIEYTDNEARDVFNAFVRKTIDEGVAIKGTFSQQIYGEEGKMFPAFVSMELTNKCNFRCTHCYKEAEKTNHLFLDTKLALEIMEQLSGKVYSLDLTGGEATLHPDFSEIAKAAKVGRLCLLTNGSRLSAMSDETLECFDLVQISVYGNTAKTYENFARSSLFESVCRGIQRVVSSGIECVISIQLRADVIKNIYDYVGLLGKLGVKNIRFGISQRIGRNKNNSLYDWDTSFDDFDYFMNEFQSIKAKYPEMMFTVPSWEDIGEVELGEKPVSRIVCSAGTRSVVISEKGGVRPCVYMPAKHFEKISWPEYFDGIENGQIFDFNRCIPECVKELEKEGSNILSICKNGFL